MYRDSDFERFYKADFNSYFMVTGLYLINTDFFGRELTNNFIFNTCKLTIMALL